MDTAVRVFLHPPPARVAGFSATRQQFCGTLQAPSRCGDGPCNLGGPARERTAATFPGVCARAAACAFSSLRKGSWVKVNEDVAVAGNRCDDGGGKVSELHVSGTGSTAENIESGVVVAVVLAHHHSQC